jgi:hypothetical protein
VNRPHPAPRRPPTTSPQKPVSVKPPLRHPTTKPRVEKTAD